MVRLPVSLSVVACVVVLATGACGGLAGGARLQIPQEHARQFDFWVGRWEVTNRHLQQDGSWQNLGAADAQIDSVLGGRAILEQWTGRGSQQLRGFSLRTYDAQQQRWEIALNWHTGTPSTFSYMVGNFAGNRGEFFPLGPQPRTRFTFSKATATSCEWDQATTRDGTEWTKRWVMNFSRRGPAATVDAETLPVQGPPAAVLNRFPSTRELDGLIGVWQGAAKRLTSTGTWEQGTAVRRMSSMIDGFGLLQMTRYSWGEESIAALSFNHPQGKWFEVGMSTDEPDCHWLAGTLADGQLRLNELPTSNNGVHHVWRSIQPDEFQWSREQFIPGSTTAAKVVTTVEFQRGQ